MIVYKVYEITKYAAFVSFLKYTDFLTKMNGASVKATFRIEVLKMSAKELAKAREKATAANTGIRDGWRKKRKKSKKDLIKMADEIQKRGV